MSRDDVLPAHGRRRRPRLKRVLLLGVPGAFLLLLLVALAAYVRTDVPPPDSLATAGATRILYSDGSELGRVGGQNRIPVRLDAVPQHVRDAVLAAEDRGHYSDPGISPRGIARALFTNVRGGGDIQQGGSTITQQYAKNAFLTSERTYTRKVKEIFISLKMTREQSKDEILENYLNTIYFGRGAYGISVASSTYFDKPVEELTPSEGAVLASVIRSPANYDPERFPERAQDRWRYVVNGMVETGALTPEQAGTVEYPAVRPAAEADKANDLSGPKGHVITKVMAELEAGLEVRGQQQLLPTGLEVTTNLRREAQEAAVAAVEEVVGTPGEGDELAPKGALVSVEPQTGAVVAYYGGSTGTGFDYASQGEGRQPGSSFKPFVLAAALDEGISLRSTFDGNNRKRFPGVPEPVRNFGDRSFGRVNLMDATRNSVNTAYFELGLEVGTKKVADIARAAGYTTPLGGEAPEGGISLGTYEVRVIDQAVGYAAFANGGQRVVPHFINTVRQGDDEVYTNEPERSEAFSEDVAADVTAALQTVVQSGTGTRARLQGGRPAAGKTGTTSENFDVWFAGYTPQLSTAVWVGTGRNETLQIEGVREATGGVVSAGIWKSYTDAASAGMPVERFPPAANIGRARGGSSTGSGSDSDRTTAPRTRRPAPPPTREPQTTAPGSAAARAGACA
ncbi:MAG TPA: transglycosylase domain-containing protein, partial [Mycobacteriales bacterium]|nr:transglycosylase domain-containing protein [Mycobacteriales bacterium]